MRFSIFTPTHHPEKLRPAWESLLLQDFTDWEWVVGVNNGATFEDIPPDILRDTRVVAVRLENSPNIGALKHELCSNCCNGEYLVELDHDDELFPYALRKIQLQLQAHNDPEFAYSDVMRVQADGQGSQLFSQAFGWGMAYALRHPYNDTQHRVQPNFDVTAASLHEIFYSPDHVRVWRRDFYDSLNGHDENLHVADDHDLLIRSYLAGARMIRIPDCLYIYNLQPDGGNTYLKRNAEIQARQRIIGDQYRDRLISEWCRREGLLKVELGGGRRLLRDGVLGLSLHDSDITLDIMLAGLPFGDDTVGVIYAYDFLEHIPHCRDSRCSHENAGCTVGLMNEIHRVLSPNGWLISSTPSTSGRGAFQDPTHCSFWNTNSFWYYTQAQQAKYIPGLRARFIQRRLEEMYPSDWHKLHEIPYVQSVMIALKQPRQPGLNGFWKPSG